MTNEKKLEALQKSYVTEEKVYQCYLKNYESVKAQADKAKALTDKQKKFLKVLSGKINDLDKRIKDMQPW